MIDIASFKSNLDEAQKIIKNVKTFYDDYEHVLDGKNALSIKLSENAKNSILTVSTAAVKNLIYAEEELANAKKEILEIMENLLL